MGHTKSDIIECDLQYVAKHSIIYKTELSALGPTSL